MKHKILLLIISGVLLCMVCCKKANTTNPDTLTGKWQEIKLRSSVIDSGKTTLDTTNLSSFSNLDYVQFNGRGTCEISTFGYYFTPQGVQVNSQSIDTAHYTAIGNGKFLLNIQSMLVTPGGFHTADTITKINSNNILIHSVFYSQVPKYETIIDTYYQK